MTSMEITDPREIELLRLYNAYPAEHRPAIARYLPALVDGTPDGEAAYRFAIAVGHTEAEARAMADELVAAQAREGEAS